MAFYASVTGTPTVVTESDYGTSASHSHTFPTSSNPNRILWIIIHRTSAAQTLSNVQYGGVSATELIAHVNDQQSVYYILESSLGSFMGGNSYNLTFDWSADPSFGGISAVFMTDNSKQSSFDTATGGTFPLSTDIVTSEDNMLILDAAMVQAYSGSFSAGTGQTEIFTQFFASPNDTQHGSSYKEAGVAGTYTMEWNTSSDEFERHALWAIAPQAIDETGKAIIVTGAVSETNSATWNETAKALTAVAAISETDFKVQFETELSFTAVATVSESDTYVHIETGRSITMVGVLSETDGIMMNETGKSFTMVGVLNSYLGAFTPTPKGGAAGSFTEQTPNSSGGFTRA